jgi:hypothetical protein
MTAMVRAQIGRSRQSGHDEPQRLEDRCSQNCRPTLRFAPRKRRPAMPGRADRTSDRKKQATKIFQFHVRILMNTGMTPA